MTQNDQGLEVWTAEQWAEFTAKLRQDDPKTPVEWFEQMAKLSPVEYDQQRQAVAKRLDIRVSTLDDEVEKRHGGPSKADQDRGGIILQEPEPWPSPVNAADLLDVIVTVFEKYVILPAGSAWMLALWVLHTYLLDAADASPIVAILSPEKRCGKTVLLEILQALVYRALPASNITAAALFRTIDRFQPTLLIDEGDSFLPDNDELRGILNSGHRRQTAVIIRTTGDDHEPKTFSTWCPKAIAAIGKLPATIEDRSIIITMRRKLPQEKVDRLRFKSAWQDLRDIRRKLSRWADDNCGPVSDRDPSVPSALNDRTADCWRPLLAIAEAAGTHWPKQARQVAESISKNRQDESVSVQLLADIQMVFGISTKLSSQTIVDELTELEDRPWPEWKHGRPMSKGQLARQLERFGIKPKTIRLGGETGVTAKGYELDQFADAFSRYLPDQNVTTSQSTPDVGLEPE